MLKGKKWLIGVCSMLLAFGITACSGSDDNSSSSNPNTSVPDSSSSVETPPVVDPAVTLSSETLNMNLFEKSTLTASLTELTGDVVWSTSDASVATVENGVVRALKVGTVTITATVGEYSDTCAVTIARGELKPTFDAMSAVSVIVGHTYDLDATLTLNDEAFELATITYASEGEYLTVTPAGKVTAVKEGSQKVTVTATYEGETLATAEVTVNVIEVGVIETGIDMNVLSLKVTNLNGDSVTQYSLAGFKATVNGLVVNKTISYTVENEDVVKVEDGKIVAVAAGETVVTAKFTADSNKEYTTEITVTVGKELVAQDVEFKVKASEEKSANTGTSEIDFTGKDLDIKVSDITKVLCNGAEITFSVNENVLTLTNAPAGEQTYVFETAKVDVELQGFIYQRVISTKADLLAFGANYNGQYGYTVLANDIDMEGETFALDTIAWLRCTFDGQGYTISNLRTTQGFLGNFNEKGVLKNLQLVNIVLERPETDTKGEIGLLGSSLCGKVENVLVFGYIKNAKENQPLLAGNDYSGTVYNNVVIIASTDQPTLAVSGSGFNYSQGAGATGAGVYYVTSQKIQVKPSNATKLEAAAYATIQEFVQKADFSTFGEPWDVESLQMSDFEDNLKQFDVVFDGTIAAGSTIIVNTTLFDAVVSVKEDTTGIVATGRSLQIVENGRYTIVVKSANDPENYKEIDLIVATTEEISTTETYVETKGGNTTLNLSKLSKTIGGVTDVAVNGKAVTQSVSDNVLTFANAQTGAITLTIYSEADNTNYKITVNVADFIIDNAAEFAAWANAMSDYKYAVLANDITMDESVGLATWNKPFAGMFDGQNYTVYNACFSYGLFVNNGVKAGAVMKNVKFDNLIIGGYGLFGGYVAGGLIENFHATVNLKPNYNYNDAWAAYFCQMPTGTGANTFTIKNSNIVFNSPDKTKNLKLYSDDNYYSTNFENVNILINGLVAQPGETDLKGNVATSATKTQASWKNVTIKDNRTAVVPTVVDEKWTLDLTTMGLTDKTISAVKDQLGKSVAFTQEGNVLTFTYEKQIAMLLTVIASDDTTGTAFVALPYYAMADSATETTYEVAYIQITDGAFAIDLTKVGVSINDLKRVLINNEKATYTLDGTTVNVTGFAGNLGESKIHVKTGEVWYVFDVIIADYVITDQASFKAFRQSNANTYKYAVLANSFTADGTTDLGGTAGGHDFTATLNGLGNTITNGFFNYGWGTWGARMAGGTIKNITFENMIVGNAEYGIFGDYWEGGTLENVNMSVYFKTGRVLSSNWSSFLCNPTITADLNMKNCNFVITVPEAFTETPFSFFKNDGGFYSGTIENVNVISNAQLTGYGEKDYSGTYTDCDNPDRTGVSYTNYNLYDRDVLEALNTTNAYAMLTEGKAKATASMFGATEMPAAADIVKVYVDGVTVTDYTLETDGITVPTTAGQHTVVIMTKTGSYAALLTAATKEIGSAEALTSLWKTDKPFEGQYIVLTQDITYEEGAAAFDCYGKSATAGVFDGRGFTVKNFPAAMFANNDKAFVMKNVTFDNAPNLKALTWYVSDNTAFLNVNIINTKWNAGNMLLSNSNATFIHLVNCNFNLTCDDAKKDTAIQVIGDDHYYKFFMYNTTIAYTGTLVNFDDTSTAGGAEHRYGWSNDGKKVLSCAYNVTFTDKDGSMHWVSNQKDVYGTAVTKE